jgi:hypothetical protein
MLIPSLSATSGVPSSVLVVGTGHGAPYAWRQRLARALCCGGVKTRTSFAFSATSGNDIGQSPLAPSCVVLFPIECTYPRLMAQATRFQGFPYELACASI